MTALEETLCAISNSTIRLSGQMASLVDTIKAVGEKVNKTDGKAIITSACAFFSLLLYVHGSEMAY